jgi:hypothetical protein
MFATSNAASSITGPVRTLRLHHTTTGASVA